MGINEGQSPSGLDILYGKSLECFRLAHSGLPYHIHVPPPIVHLDAKVNFLISKVRLPEKHYLVLN
jgi:hypothetical protein